MKYSYTLENLNCAHCAQKIETKIAETDGFEGVSFNFATKKLNFESEKKNPLSEIQQICDDIEDGVTVKDNNEKSDDDSPSKVERILLRNSTRHCGADNRFVFQNSAHEIHHSRTERGGNAARRLEGLCKGH